MGIPCAVLIVASAVSADAQEPAPKPPVFASDVQLITVDAVVVDKDGRPVPGLTQNDFIVKENGRVQKVASFEAVVVPAAGGSTDAALPRAGRTPRGRSFALVVDDVNMTTPEAHAAQQALARFAGGSLSAGDSVILATTSGARWAAFRMPEGREPLVAALATVRGLGVDTQTDPDYMSDAEAYSLSDRNAGTWAMAAVMDRWGRSGICGAGIDGQNNPACVARALAQATAVDAERRTRSAGTLASLQRVMRQLSADPGRKAVFFVSKGFVADGDPVARETAALSREVNAAIYFLDARGLLALDATGVPGAPYVGGAPNPRVLPSLTLEASTLATGGAEDLALDTGGFAVRNNNDLGLAANRIADQSRVFYLLGFHPPSGKAGAWRKIKVEVTKKGYSVQARRGYKLSPVPPPPPSGTSAPSGNVSIADAVDDRQ
jgi:VWFA-related protein